MVPMPGRRRLISDDTVNLAMIVGGLFLILFFLLALRVFLDARAGKPIAPLTPTRSPFNRTR